MKVKWTTFLYDVLLSALGSYGGPEAHYGMFSSLLVKKRKYLKEEELTEMIGLYALVPGPSSTQTITAIGYYIGGPVLALLTFLVWALPAIIVMSLIGVFFNVIGNTYYEPMLTYLPAVAVGFIIYAFIILSVKVIKDKRDFLLYSVMFLAAFLYVGFSMWVIPLLLMLGGFITLLPYIKELSTIKVKAKPRWWILLVIIMLALLSEVLLRFFDHSFFILFNSFYRYGYSVIGGGNIVIPLMIQDLVETKGLLSLNDFLSGYAIDQAIPGPLFSFAGFVGARSVIQMAFLSGIISGLSIFLPGILLVFFIFPLWQQTRHNQKIKHFLKGVSITAASLILMTAIKQSFLLEVDIKVYLVVVITTLLLITKRLPAPLIILLALLLGFIL
ncbi:MAG: chromate efflux transporter [Acholeplasmataceae bacterium]